MSKGYGNEKPKVDLSNLEGSRILLAEDDPDHQHLLVQMLRGTGCELTVSGDGETALELAADARDAGQPFDIIIVDIQMPVLDGYATVRRLRQSGFTTPVLALTARALTTELDRAIEAGCDDYMAKPFGRSFLRQWIADHLPEPAGHSPTTATT